MYAYDCVVTLRIQASGLDTAWRAAKHAAELANGADGVEAHTSMLDLHHCPQRDGSLRAIR